MDPNKVDPQSYLQVSKTIYVPKPATILGVGSFGKVFACIQYFEATKEQVEGALKLFVKAGQNPWKVKREIDLTLQASHEKIVKVLDSGEFPESNGQVIPYMVLEKMASNLRTFMKKNMGQPFAAPAAALLFKDMLDAVEHLHDQGIYHRDIKPENFLLDKQNHIKLSDFGEATLEGLCSTVKGTPEYMHPEIFKVEEGSNDAYKAADADIYALGLTLYNISYNPNYVRLNRNKKDDMTFESTKYTKLPRNPLVPMVPEYWELIDGMTREKDRLTIQQIRQNKWLVDSLAQTTNLESSVVLDDIVKSNGSDTIMLTILRSLRKKYLDAFLSYSHEAVISLIERLTLYYSSEATDLASVSPLVANVLKYSKAIAVSRFMMMKVWATSPRTEHEVQLDPISLVFMMNPEAEQTLARLLDLVHKDSSIDFKRANISQIESSYLKYMKELSEVSTQHPQFDACVAFSELIGDNCKEEAFLPAFKIEVKILEVQLQNLLIALRKFRHPLDSHAQLCIDAYMARTEFAAQTCAGISKLSASEIRDLITENSPYDNKDVSDTFIIAQTKCEFIDIYTENTK